MVNKALASLLLESSTSHNALNADDMTSDEMGRNK